MFADVELCSRYPFEVLFSAWSPLPRHSIGGELPGSSAEVQQTLGPPQTEQKPTPLCFPGHAPLPRAFPASSKIPPRSSDPGSLLYPGQHTLPAAHSTSAAVLLPVPPHPAISSRPRCWRWPPRPQKRRPIWRSRCPSPNLIFWNKNNILHSKDSFFQIRSCCCRLKKPFHTLLIHCLLEHRLA